MKSRTETIDEAQQSKKSEKESTMPPLPTRSLLERIGFGGVLSCGLAGLLCLLNILLYAVLPLAGLGFLPFVFFGGVCLMTGIADQVGFYD